MNKLKNNIVNTNPTIIDVLKQNISKKLENQDKLVKIEKLHIECPKMMKSICKA